MPHHIRCFYLVPIASVTASERSRVRNSILTLILLFTPERALFCSNASYLFEVVSSRLALGRCSFFVTGRNVKICVVLPLVNQLQA